MHKQKHEAELRITALLQRDCDAMCRASGAAVVCGLFGGAKHNPACLWFKVERPGQPPAAVAVTGKIIGVESHGPEPAPVGMKPKFCGECGGTFETDTQKFCNYCGAKTPASMNTPPV